VCICIKNFANFKERYCELHLLFTQYTEFAIYCQNLFSGLCPKSYQTKSTNPIHSATDPTASPIALLSSLPSRKNGRLLNTQIHVIADPIIITNIAKISLSPTMTIFITLFIWSGIRGSNSTQKLGRLRHSHYTNPAIYFQVSCVLFKMKIRTSF
jgi:hypothetical protein